MSKKSVIWYAWAHIPGGVVMAKIEHYDKLKKTCTITLSGGISIIEMPFNKMEAVNGCILPWEV